ncbi:signal peptidase subunit [Phanerochaete sordida]|uniref:Signal peptidase subunit 3 n=1 Tax=Phanerochaete sordida TaxID=48140 RepID=A0A9P3LD04_9APHY|nr:signal peptidase subunit [Phanerochaete sordida]
MHTVYSRINNVSAFLSSCLMALLAAIALSSLVFTADPKGILDVQSLNIYEGHTRRYHNRWQDVTFVNFNLTADLTPLFNWNTKQLFLYLQAEYVDAKGVKNEVVIWDRIIHKKDKANLSLNGRNKYVFRNLGKSFKGASAANYTLKYNVMPYVGLLTYGEAARTGPLAFPEKRTEVA